MAEPREIVTRKYVCDGCPHLTTEDWTFMGENDDYDSGTNARCLKANLSISGYYRRGDACPAWCPMLAID